MRILFVVPYFAPAWSFGGPVKVVYDLSKELIRQGHEVTVATTDVVTKDKRHNKKTDTLEGIRVVYFKNISNALAYKANLYIPLGFRGWLKKNIHHYDIIHCHDLFTGLNIIVSYMAPRYGIPFIVQPHGALNEGNRKSKRKIIKSVFLNLFSRVLRLASRIIVLTEIEKNGIKNIFENFARKTLIVPNGLQISQLTQPKSNPQLRLKLGMRPEEKMILFVGRVHYIKGVDITLEALSLLKKHHFKLVIIGREEGMTSSLKSLSRKLNIEDKIIFLGPIFGQSLSEYFAAADLFILNSRSEGLPMAVLDSCAAGLPVIISPHCNLPEVETFGAGIVLKYNTPEETARLIIAYFSEPALSAVMRKKCHQLITDHFNLTKTAQQYIAIYEKLVKTY